MARLPEGFKKLNALVPVELHKRVREEVYDRKISIDKYIQQLLLEHFRTQLSGKEVYTGSESRQFSPEVALPETFLRNAQQIYLASADEWAALSRVVAAVSRGQESLRVLRDSDRFAKIVQPLPAERQPKEDDKDRTG